MGGWWGTSGLVSSCQGLRSAPPPPWASVALSSGAQGLLRTTWARTLSCLGVAGRAQRGHNQEERAPLGQFSRVWLPQHSGMGCHGERKVLAWVPSNTGLHPTAPTPAPNPPTGCCRAPAPGGAIPTSQQWAGGAAGNTHLAQAERGGTKIRRLLLPSLSLPTSLANSGPEDGRFVHALSWVERTEHLSSDHSMQGRRQGSEDKRP